MPLVAICVLSEGWSVTIDGTKKFGGYLVNVYTQRVPLGRSVRQSLTIRRPRSCLKSEKSNEDPRLACPRWVGTSAPFARVCPRERFPPPPPPQRMREEAINKNDAAKVSALYTQDAPSIRSWESDGGFGFGPAGH